MDPLRANLYTFFAHPFEWLFDVSNSIDMNADFWHKEILF